MANRYTIEICPNEPRASVCGMNGESVANDPDIADCRASGDCEPACLHVLSLGVEFRIIARNAAGEYENRLATDAELEATARATGYGYDKGSAAVMNAIRRLDPSEAPEETPHALAWMRLRSCAAAWDGGTRYANAIEAAGFTICNVI